LMMGLVVLFIFLLASIALYYDNNMLIIIGNYDKKN
jgi:hypothetical protein